MDPRLNTIHIFPQQLIHILLQWMYLHKSFT